MHIVWICGEPLAARVRTATARRLADLLHRVSHLARRFVPRDLRSDDDADQMTVLDDWETADLPIGHDARRLRRVGLWTDGDGIRAHDLRDRRGARVLPRGDPADDQVTIGHDPDELPVLHDRDRATVVLLHERGGLRDGILWADRRWLGGHQLADLHETPPAQVAGAGTRPTRRS